MEHLLISIIASIILLFRNVFRVFKDPYTAMRDISKEKDTLQVVFILAICCTYFAYAASIRHKTINPFVITTSAMASSIGFLVTFGLSVGFLYVSGRVLRVSQKEVVLRLCSLSAFSLIPTLLWFYATSTLFLLLPPPRQSTALGIFFSIVFVIYSLILLNWRLMLLYITIRFSLKTTFVTTLKIAALYLLLMMPYSIMLYKIGLFRVPFI